MVPQRVAQGCTSVLKRCGNGAQKLLKGKQYSENGAAMTQASVINTIIIQKHTKRTTNARALRNCTCNAQWRALGAREQTNKQTNNKQTNKQPNKHTHRKTDKQTSKQANKQATKHTHKTKG